MNSHYIHKSYVGTIFPYPTLYLKKILLTALHPYLNCFTGSAVECKEITYADTSIGRNSQ